MPFDGPVFKRLAVDCIITGGTRVSWELNPHFIDTGPYTFQLQIGHTQLEAEADDWVDVGAPVIDGYYTIDLSKRVWGKTQETHYRVKLTTGVDTYYSYPEGCDGHLSKRDWLTARDIVRKEVLRHRVLTSPAGYLLKARRYGPRCSACTDALTEEVSRSNCPICYGTGFELGYFDPMPACFADISVESNREHRDANKGMDKQDVVKARFIGDPQLYSYDVWINKTSDERFYFHTVAVVAQVRGVPLIYDVELRLAPFSDVVYTIAIDSQNELKRARLEKEKKEKLCLAKPTKPELNYLATVFEELKAKGRTRSSRR